MKAEDRASQILESLRQRHYVSVGELSRNLGVSQMTIRRDLQELEDAGVLQRVYGGAKLRQERSDADWPVSVRQNERMEAKRSIGRAAAALVHDGDVVLIDGGSTTLQVAQNLTQQGLTVATNFLPILNSLSNRGDLHLVSVGGTLHADNMSFFGELAIASVRSIRANLAIMGTGCLTLAKGLTNRNARAAEVKKAMMAAAERVVLVMDSSKVGECAAAPYAPLEAIHILVTDEGIAPADRAVIVARGVQVIVVPVEPDGARAPR